MATTNTSTTFDVVILNGRVLDPETNLDKVCNVGINGGTIEAITEKDVVLVGTKKTIDASGLCVVPGFIDMHSHTVPCHFGQKLHALDGVTTPMELEMGCFPVADWYDDLEGRSITNYGCSVSVATIREHAFNPDYKTLFHGDIMFDAQYPEMSHTSMKWSTVVPNQDQIDSMYVKIEDGLKEGALGVGFTPGYMVGGCTQQESLHVQMLAGKYGVSSFVHARFSSQAPPTSGILGFEEMMAPQATYGGGIVFHHMHAQALIETPKALKMIDDANAKGFPICPEIYPYNYGGTIIGADYLKPSNYQRCMCRSYNDIIEVADMKCLTKERYEELIMKNPLTNVLFYNATEETTYKGLEHPSTVVGSDAFPYTDTRTGKMAEAFETPYEICNGHPRGAGTHGRFLRLTREKMIDIPLILAVSKMTYMIAKYLAITGVDQFNKKGRIQVGCDADITIFDWATVTDNATQEKGALPSSGIPYVLVHGVPVVENGEPLKVFPGKAVRRKV